MTNSRAFLSIECHEDRNTMGMRKVVRRISHSDSPSTPMWKWMPSGSTQLRSTTCEKPVGEMPTSPIETTKVSEREGEGRALQQAGLLLRQHEEEQRADERQEGRQAEQHYFTTTVFVSRWTVPQRGSIASTVICFSPTRS